jgi:hypothetical protein
MPLVRGYTPSMLGDATRESFFFARHVDGRVETRGKPQCFLGHLVGDADGVFARWEWDGSRLRIENDRYGFYPLFYFGREDEIAVSTSIPQLLSLGAPATLDYGALSVYMRLGFMLAEDTPFTAIRALPPGATLEWTAGSLSVRGGFWTPREQNLGREAAIDGYISLFRNAIRKRPPTQGDFCVALTGGRDSRHILLELCEQGHKPTFCVTTKHFPPRPNEDTRVAAEIAQAVGLKHVVLSQPEDRFAIELRKNLMTSFCTDEHQWSLVMADYLGGKVACVYDGIGGDVLSRSRLQKKDHLIYFQTGDFIGLANTLLGARETLARVVPPDEHQRMGRDLAVERLSSELRRHAKCPNPIGSFFFWNRTRREISLIPYRILRNIDTVFSPYLDRELFDFLSSLRGSSVVGEDLHTEVIRRAYPKYAHIGFEDPNARPCPDFGFFRAWARRTLQYVLKQDSRFVRKRHVVPRLIRCMVDKRYSPSISWIAPMTTYLLQLEETATQVWSR